MIYWNMGFILAVAAGALIFYLSALSVYRLTLHPLAKYPGPTLAAISNWYVLFYTWRGDMHVQHQSWHARYGNIVRAGPNWLWFNDPSMMSDIYSVGVNVRKADPWIALSPSRRSGNILNTIDKTIHGFKKSTIRPLFSDHGLRQLEDRIVGKIERFTSLLPASIDDAAVAQDADGWGPAQDMAALCDWLAFDVMSDIAYGKELSMLQSPEMRWIPKVYTKMSQRSMMSLMQPKVYEWKLDQIFLACMYKDILKAGTWAYNHASARASRGRDENIPDLFNAIMSAKDHKRGLEYKMRDLWIESMLLLPAGADTTSTTMSAAFFYLLHNQPALSRATAEVRSTFSSVEEIGCPMKTNLCQFLQACINETMRLVPAVPLASPRHVEAGGITVDGEYIPEGTVVGSSVYTIQRNPAYFHKPDSFCPERWIADPAAGVTEEAVDRALQAFLPFSIGPRSCVGWKLGWMELSITLARTLFLYDIRLADGAPCCANRVVGEKCSYNTKAWAIMAREGPVVQFRRARG